MPTTPNLAALRRSPAVFRRHLRVDTDDGPRPFDGVLDPWQRADFEALDPGWQRVAYQRPDPGRPVLNRGYLERPRGHSKSTDTGANATYALFASSRQINGLVVASDKDQAAILRQAILKFRLLNKWLRPYIEVQRWRVLNPVTQSELTILSSDAGSAYGRTPDFAVADELTHWSGKAGQELWTALFSSVPKRKRCMLAVISNAGVGMGKSWQWRVREAARRSDRWYFHRIDGPQATWQDPADLEEQRLMLPPSAFARLWLNQWTQNDGDALPVEDIEACLVLDGPPEPRPGCVYVGALDLGVKRDHSAWCVLEAEPGRPGVRLVKSRRWRPDPGGQVDLSRVESQVLADQEKYQLAWIGYDPHQAYHLAQRLTKAKCPMVEISFAAGKNLDLMARELLHAFRSRSIEMYPHPTLQDDLRRLCIVQRRYGFKLDAVRDESGHADEATALAIALPAALEVSAMDRPVQQESPQNAVWRVVA